ncbi:MAG: hypothetical protein DHS20C18_38940 [Saprospiraceae bacterium]|nr:MAG: hypothetical protein DHS20C18_38940 [Saprospiraceae bacterium]
MKKSIASKGFLAAGIINIGGVLLFSRFFTNEILNQADPVVMSNFGLVMIIVWGLAYIAVAKSFDQVRWISAVFAVEKLVYVVVWGLWMSNNDLGALYSKDMFAGIFYTIYGLNDLLFMLFFMWIFLKSAKIS